MIGNGIMAVINAGIVFLLVFEISNFCKHVVKKSCRKKKEPKIEVDTEPQTHSKSQHTDGAITLDTIHSGFPNEELKEKNTEASNLEF